jgi:hypothetical protein
MEFVPESAEETGGDGDAEENHQRIIAAPSEPNAVIETKRLTHKGYEHETRTH